MKKLYTLFAALLATASLSAETITWTIDDLSSTYSSGTSVDNATLVVNDYISLTFMTADGGSYVPTYRKGGSDNAGYIAFYNGNSLTVSAENATLNSITFTVDDNADAPVTASNNTPNWKVLSGGTTYNASNPTWTGNAQSMAFIGSSKTTILALTFEYTVEEEKEPDTPDTPGDFQTANLFFSSEQVATGEGAQDITITDNGVTVHLFSNNANAACTATNGYFGTADEFETLGYRWQPISKSSASVGGEITVPCAGTLYIYAYNNSANSTRHLIFTQNGAEVFNEEYSDTDYVTPEGQNKKVYPVKQATLQKGTANITWPDNQITFYGFVFEPDADTTAIEQVVEESAKEGNGLTYDLNGRVVGDDYKGIIIKDGKKYLRR